MTRLAKKVIFIPSGNFEILHYSPSISIQSHESWNEHFQLCLMCLTSEIDFDIKWWQQQRGFKYLTNSKHFVIWFLCCSINQRIEKIASWSDELFTTMNSKSPNDEWILLFDFSVIFNLRLGRNLIDYLTHHDGMSRLHNLNLLYFFYWYFDRAILCDLK